MAKPPSLVNLCATTLKTYILYGEDVDDGILQGIYELPSELFDCLLNELPALALHRLQLQMPSEKQDDFDFEYDCSGNGGKRVRCGKFDMAWKALFYLRWPEIIQNFQVKLSARKSVLECETIYDWQLKYWEMHLQNCFDAAAERAMIPCFDQSVGEVKVPGALIKAIGCEEQTKCPSHDYSRLRNHCQEFGSYARFLRLQNVFCNADTCHLLANCKLQGLVIRRIFSQMHVDGLCMILNQNKETIKSLELVNCKISSAFFEAICHSLHAKSTEMHGVMHFAVKGSKFLEVNSTSLPPKLVSFLSSRHLSA